MREFFCRRTWILLKNIFVSLRCGSCGKHFTFLSYFPNTYVILCAHKYVHIILRTYVCCPQIKTVKFNEWEFVFIILKSISQKWLFIPIFLEKYWSLDYRWMLVTSFPKFTVPGATVAVDNSILHCLARIGSHPWYIVIVNAKFRVEYLQWNFRFKT